MNTPKSSFIIWSPDYTHMSSGVRCLFLLCHHLNRSGYEAYITGRKAPAHLVTRFADDAEICARRHAGMDDITIYPEIVSGNPLNSRKVVRYLLNKPGAVSDTSMSSYGADEYFLHYAPEFLPAGVRSRRLWIPTLDLHIFHQRAPSRRREGFVVYAARAWLEISSIPDWVNPRVIVTEEAPRGADEMADLYRSSRALVTWERTAAIWEAMQCGCPTIIVPHPDFNHAPIVRRSWGCGIGIGWNRRRLALAERTVQLGKLLYNARAIGTTRKVRRFAEEAQAYFLRRDTPLKPPS